MLIYLKIRDGSDYQDGWIFWKLPRGWGVIFNPKIYFADFVPVYRAFFGCFPKKMQHNFLSMRRWIIVTNIQVLYKEQLPIWQTSEWFAKYVHWNRLKRSISFTFILYKQTIEVWAPNWWFCCKIRSCGNCALYDMYKM